MKTKNNFLLQFFYKIFNRTRYQKNKNLIKIEKDKKIFKENFENYINSIQVTLKKKKEMLYFLLL